MRNLPDSIRELILFTNNCDIPHYVETLKIRSFSTSSKKKYPHVKKLYILGHNMDFGLLCGNLGEYLKKYFPSLETCYAGETNMLKF